MFFIGNGSWQGWGWGRTQFSLRGWPLGARLSSSESMSNTKWTWFFFFSFLASSSIFGGEGGQGYKGGVDLGGLRSKYDQGALCEIPK